MMGDADDDPEVILLRAVRSTLCASGIMTTDMRLREVADSLTAAIVKYVEGELCRCGAGTDDCPLASHL